MGKIILTIALIFALAAVFLFGFRLVGRLDQFRKENRRRLAYGILKKRRPIRVAAESEALLDAARLALDYCETQHPYMEFRCTCAPAGQLLQDLYTRRIDIAILTAEHASGMDTVYSAVPIADLREELCAVWNNTVPCKDRDTVLTALENDHLRLKSGYCDYNE
jgi:DNA-binding transcriptional LysR family regulator